MIAFLNQRCDNWGYVQWDNEKDLHGFIYDRYLENPRSLDVLDLFEQARNVQRTMVEMITPILARDVDTGFSSETRTREIVDLSFNIQRALTEEVSLSERKDDDGYDLPSLLHSMFSLLLWVLENGWFWNIAKCPQCEIFFTRARTSKERYCSDDCYTRHDQKSSKDRQHRSRSGHVSRTREIQALSWLEAQFSRPSQEPNQQTEIYQTFIKVVLARDRTEGWKQFDQWKGKPRDFWAQLPQYRRKQIEDLARAGATKV